MELPDLLDLLRSKGVTEWSGAYYIPGPGGTAGEWREVFFKFGPPLVPFGPGSGRLDELSRAQGRPAPPEEFNAADIVLGRVGVPVATEGEG